MKKLLAMILVAIMLFSLASCVSVSVEEDVGGAKSETETKKETEKETKPEKETETKPATETVEKPDETDPPETDEIDIDDYLGDEVQFHGIAFRVPIGFKKYEESGVNLYVPNDYPVHSDNISLSLGNEKFEDFNEGDYLAQIKQLGEIDDFDFEKYDEDGYKYAVISYYLTISNIEMYQDVIVYFKDNESVTLAYTYVSDEYYDYLDASYYSCYLYTE